MNLTQKQLIYLYNYYIEKGSFSNLSKENQRLYKECLNWKKSVGKDDVTVTKFLEMELIPNKNYVEIESNYMRKLLEHYDKYGQLDGTDIDRQLESMLKKNANYLGVEVKELIQKFDKKKIYPDLISKINNRISIRDYNSMLHTITINLILDSSIKPNIDLPIFQAFESFEHLRSYEPGYATFLKSRIPVYSGKIIGSSDVKFIVEGVKYFGEDLKLELFPTLMQDLFYALKGYVSRGNLTPSITFKLRHMMNNMGNLNFIGMDKLKMLEELDDLTLITGHNSIAELLRDEGFEFTPLTAEEVSVVPYFKDYKLLIDGKEESEILIPQKLKDDLESMDLMQTLSVHTGNVGGKELTLLFYTYNNEFKTAHELITGKPNLEFLNSNTLDLRIENLMGGNK